MNRRPPPLAPKWIALALLISIGFAAHGTAKFFEEMRRERASTALPHPAAGVSPLASAARAVRP